MDVLTQSFAHAHSAVLKSARFGALFVDAAGTPGTTAETGRDHDGGDAAESPDSAPALHFFRQIVLDALASRASDVHIEPGPHDLRVRLRVDGVLRDHLLLPGWMHASLVGAIKSLARLDTTQQHLPQDGRTHVRGRSGPINLHVSTMPTGFGEKAILHLARSSESPALSGLGLSVSQRVLIENALGRRQGLILVVGPAGAGTSTTLRSLLAHRRASEANVEVAEIRDRETARMAFEAALSGHAVLGRLHVDNSLEAIDRLLDLGVTESLLASATNLIVAQRRVRRICSNCREPYEPPRDVLDWLNLDALRQFERGRGCVQCGHTGYSGRIGIFEVLNGSSHLLQSLTREATEADRTRVAVNAGVRLLLDDALDKMYRGLTTVEEVMRAMRNEPAGGKKSPGSMRVCHVDATRLGRLGRLAS